MRKEFTYPSCGEGVIRACVWEQVGELKGIVQIVHGIAEHILRYDHFASYLNANGYLVVAEDHMGHGASAETDDAAGYFAGGWFSAVNDTVKLAETIQVQYPDVPYYLLGHSMGSFMARTILAKHTQLHLDGCILSGTGWQNNAVLFAGIQTANAVCKFGDPRKPSKLLHSVAFGSYNRKVERPRTSFDWLTRDARIVDAYVDDPMCGFVPAAGLMRDMLNGISYIQKVESMTGMRKNLPIFFISGGDDPVGDYGAGVNKTVERFKEVGMQNISTRIYPMCRHEILNEINKEQVYSDVLNWLDNLGKQS